MTDYQSAFRRYLVGPPGEDGEVRAFCPHHEDPDTSKTPSASFNFTYGLWHCMGCSHGGDVAALYKELRGKRRSGSTIGSRSKNDSNVVPISKARKPAKPAEPTTNAAALPDAAYLAACTNRLLKQPSLLKIMVDERGLRVDTIKEFNIGHDTYRFTIPVYDENGVLVNVRRYNPKARRAQDKMLNIQGHGSARIFRPDLLAKYDKVIITEGEMDAIIAHQNGLPAISCTGGAGTFRTEWGPLFAGKQVYLCYDCDDAGDKGAVKAAKVLAQHAAAVYIVRLPMDAKGADISDYFVTIGYKSEDFRNLMLEAEKTPWGGRRKSTEVPTSGLLVGLEESMSSENKETLEMIVQIAGKTNPPFIIPKKFRALCDQDKGNVCSFCPMSAWNGEHVEEIPSHDAAILDFTDISKHAKMILLRKIIGARCADHLEITIEENRSVEELLVMNSVDYRGEEDQTPISRRVFSVGTYKTPINTTARIVGRQSSDPKSQRGSFQSWSLEETKTNLDRFQMTERIHRALQTFQCRRGQTPLQKCDAIAADLEANVTKIYGRADMHIAFDLVWHSALAFRFMGDKIEKGWLECLAIGDTRTGKSEVAIKLSKHYNSGVVKSCEGSTFAGIVGGVQQMGSSWMVTWGVIPRQDRRLVVLDEVSGLKDKDVIENMSSIRSSGRAQITKIATEEASARTRMIWISNPADGQRLRDNAGSAMYAIQRLVPNPEDVARFDFAIAVAGDAVDPSIINAQNHAEVAHRYKPGKCEALVLWTWSRKEDQIIWRLGAEKYVTETAMDMGSRYVSEPPLIQVENIRMKLARLAVAFACRTFSTENGEDVLVGKEHVNSAVEFLDRIYGDESMGYLRHSRRILQQREIAENRRGQTIDYLRKSAAALQGLFAIGSGTFKSRDFVEFAGMQDFEAQTLIQDLLGWKMIRRLSRGFVKMEPALIDILKQFEDEADEQMQEGT